MKPFLSRWVAVGVSVILLSGTFSVLAQSTPPPPISETGQQTRDRLLAEYQAALENELDYGQTAINSEDGSLMLVGDSKVKMDALWKDTVTQIEKAIGRSPTEQKEVKEQIMALEGTSPQYISRTVFPYNPGIAIEKYETSRYIYSVDLATGQILEVMPIDSTRFRREASLGNDRLSLEELEQRAISYVSSLDSELDVSQLRADYSDKENRNYFFRWEDPTRILPDGMTPFIQVGLSSQGELLNYVNTLGVAQPRQARVIWGAGAE